MEIGKRIKIYENVPAETPLNIPPAIPVEPSPLTPEKVPANV